uniref:BPTI/Kunitz inhibitor domain-containing protein n=1 Tax=Apteryx owenii TaxID=8824 RepID=A0A8B9PB46_APTOW
MCCLSQLSVTERAKILSGPLLCYSPKDEGLCSSSVSRYYYDSKSKTCKEFKYTGCGGNANNFVTETDCYNVCRKGKILYFFNQNPRLGQLLAFCYAEN